MNVWRLGCCFGWMAALIIFWWMRLKTPAQHSGMLSDYWRRNSPRGKARAQMCNAQFLWWAIKSNPFIPFRVLIPRALIGCATNLQHSFWRLVSRFNPPRWTIHSVHPQLFWGWSIRSLPTGSAWGLSRSIWLTNQNCPAALMFGLCLKKLKKLRFATGQILWMKCPPITKTSNWPMRLLGIFKI